MIERKHSTAPKVGYKYLLLIISYPCSSAKCLEALSP